MRSLTGILGGEITDPGGHAVLGVSCFYMDTPEGAVTFFIQRRIVERVLVSQFFRNFGVCFLKIVESCRLVDTSAGRHGQLVQITLTRLQRFEAHPQIADPKLVESYRRV